MLEKGQGESNVSEMRREVLQGIAGTAVTTAGLSTAPELADAASCGIPDDGDYDEVDYEKKKETAVTEENVPTGEGTEYALETRTSVLHLTSNYVSEDDRWTHYFYEGAHIVSKTRKATSRTRSIHSTRT